MASEIIQAFAELYTVEELDAFLRDALADLAAGVQVTSVQLEGGGGSGRKIDMDPERMVSILRRAKQVRAANDQEAGSGSSLAVEAPLGHKVNFGHRPART